MTNSTNSSSLILEMVQKLLEKAHTEDLKKEAGDTYSGLFFAINMLLDAIKIPSVWLELNLPKIKLMGLRSWRPGTRQSFLKLHEALSDRYNIDDDSPNSRLSLEVQIFLANIKEHEKEYNGDLGYKVLIAESRSSSQSPKLKQMYKELVDLGFKPVIVQEHRRTGMGSDSFDCLYARWLVEQPA